MDKINHILGNLASADSSSVNLSSQILNLVGWGLSGKNLSDSSARHISPVHIRSSSVKFN
jgi:hypothetical protein